MRILKLMSWNVIQEITCTGCMNDQARKLLTDEHDCRTHESDIVNIASYIKGQFDLHQTVMS